MTWGTALQVVEILTLPERNNVVGLVHYPNPDRCTTPTTNTSFSGYEAFWRTPRGVKDPS